MFIGVLISLLCVLTFNNGQQKPIPEFSRVNDVTSGSFCSFFRGLQENEKEEAACCGFSNYSYLIAHLEPMQLLEQIRVNTWFSSTPQM